MDSAIHLLNNRGRVNDQSLIQSTHVIKLTLILTMTTAQVVETSATVNNSPIQDYVHPDDHIFDLLYSFFRQHIDCIGWYTKVRTTTFFFLNMMTSKCIVRWSSDRSSWRNLFNDPFYTQYFSPDSLPTFKAIFFGMPQPLECHQPKTIPLLRTQRYTERSLFLCIENKIRQDKKKQNV